MHTILMALLYWAVCFLGVVIGYVVAIANVRTGRDDDYQRGFQDGVIYQKIHSFNNIEINDVYGPK